jgi:FixJ family two-component response regulator
LWATAAARAINLPSKRIISIVDDDESFRGAVKSLIRVLGLEPQTFASAEEFLNSPSLKNTACLISDVQMPGMSGIELQRRLLTAEPRLPIIFITAFPDEATERRVVQAGALGILHKPFDSDVLIDLVRRALGSFEDF